MTHVCSVYSPLCLIHGTRSGNGAPPRQRQSEQVRSWPMGMGATLSCCSGLRTQRRQRVLLLLRCWNGALSSTTTSFVSASSSFSSPFYQIILLSKQIAAAATATTWDADLTLLLYLNGLVLSSRIPCLLALNDVLWHLRHLIFQILYTL